MTSESVRIHPLSEQQERRLLDYLDGKYLEIHHAFTRRSALGELLAYYFWLITFLGMNPNQSFPHFGPTFWRRERCLH
jgi:hypothetical protein